MACGQRCFSSLDELYSPHYFSPLRIMWLTFTVIFPPWLVDVAFFFLLDGPLPPLLLMLSCHFALVVLYSFRSIYPLVLAMICRLIRHRCAPDLDYTSHHHHFLRLRLSCFLFDSLFISFGLHFSSCLNNNIANFTHHTLFCSPFA
jgi:hypothetical protein